MPAKVSPVGDPKFKYLTDLTFPIYGMVAPVSGHGNAVVQY